MATTTRVQIAGLRELGEALKLLNADMQQKVARAATGAAAGVIRKRAKALAPVAPEPYEVEGNERIKVKGAKRKTTVRSTVTVQPGNIGKQIIVKRLKPGETNLTSEHVVAVRGKKQHGYASRIGALQEFGTVKQAAQPFMRPAFEQEKGAAVNAMVDRLRKRIDKANKGGK